MCIKSDFEEIILKLAIYGQREKTFCCHKIFVLNGLSAPAWGYIHLKKKTLKKGKKNQTSKRLFINWQQMGKVIRTSKFCPHGDVCPCPGAIYIYI